MFFLQVGYANKPRLGKPCQISKRGRRSYDARCEGLPPSLRLGMGGDLASGNNWCMLMLSAAAAAAESAAEWLHPFSDK